MNIIEQARKIRADMNAITATLTDEQGLELIALFEPWALKTYAVGDRVRHGDKLYKCVQAHTAQSDWTPDKVPALWTKIGDPTEEFPEWSQPVGAHDAYAKGDKVSFGGKHWESTVDNNVWQPGVYGWNEV